MRTLYLIPARKGSKGLPGKNTRMLGDKSLVRHSMDTALTLSDPAHICISTDSDEVISQAEKCGIAVPFVRPEELANDTAGSREVILHALDFYKNKGVQYDTVVLLQPTSPFRKSTDIQQMMALYSSSLDMVVSVNESQANPYYTLFEEDRNGYLKLSKKGNFTRRQDCPRIYAYNGSVYVINASSIIEKPIRSFEKVRKYVMSDLYSVDIDSAFDWQVAEMILEKNLFSQPGF